MMASSNYQVRLSVQSPRAVVMIRPHCFYPNPDTAEDNAYQKQSISEEKPQVSQRAYQEVTAAAEKLREHQVEVFLYDDEGEATPDSVFPNNWFSTHSGGHIALYPMYSNNRRLERRSDVIEALKQRCYVQDVIDYSGLEQDQIFLEGTGAMVLDHIERVAYTAKSNRANEIALERFCTHFNYEPMAFTTADRNSQSVYHTNVMMSVGTEFAMVGTELISDEPRRQAVVDRLKASGRDVIELSQEQIDQFAGNVLELASPNGRLLALSRTAFNALNELQRKRLQQYVSFVVLDIPTIELAGGSVRCMLAGIHLATR
ncbi:citrulline utilization hydrolase CtlX [Marinobacterium jannaschii]|uniref:citrulline utilization hydrolase CtlX n=1 Tax=Marinobacterium jannaschii TaxID=64970 RepID=UPI0004802050|nr:arginine deiminase-related protein [Marinobacterium jannaschii]